MINRNIEETLFLISMEVNGHQAVDASDAQQVGHKFSTD